MSERRFTEKPDLDPSAVRSLPDGHPAMIENRTLFPSTVVEVTADAPDRLLVSGENNIKIGRTVEKGRFKGYAIFCLSLEERATCPTDCEVRGFCYGNGMQFGRRHRIGDPGAFFDRLDAEIAELARQNVGILIRLHVLGDFPSVEYVSFWKDVLDEHDNVACFGYTHRRETDEIGQALRSVKDAHRDRFRIRWSASRSASDGAVVIGHVPDGPKTVAGDLVCPAQTDATACCATCGLCWESRDNTIAFIKHGPKSAEAQAATEMLASAPADKEFEQELLRHRPALLRYGRGMARNHAEAEDLVQDVMVKALRNHTQFDRGTNMGAWLSTILRNEFLTKARKKREVEDPEGLIQEQEAGVADTAATVEAREALSRLDTLPSNTKAILLDAANGKTLAEMASEQGVPEGTIKSRVSRARDAFEKAIDAPVAKTALPVPSRPIDIKVNSEPVDPKRRRVRGISLPENLRETYAKSFMSSPPECRKVAPSTLIVEASYQRDLSGKSVRLIKNIVAKWDWAKFKPPVCAETPEGLFVIDGQHTAIAAASHPKITEIPVMVVQRPDIESRAAAFVSQNRDRLAMSPLQIFHAECVAGDKTALGILRCVVKAGASVPRSTPAKGAAKAGEIVSMTALRRLWREGRPEHLERILRIATLSGKAPISSTLLYGLDIVLTWDPVNEDCVTADLKDDEIAYTVARIDIEKEAASEAAEADIDRYHALAGIIEHNIWHVNSEAYGAQVQTAA